MSGANFANVNNNGNANYNNASNSNGIRPDFRALLFDGPIGKEKLSLGNLNTSGILPELPHGLPYAQSYDNVISGA